MKKQQITDPKVLWAEIVKLRYDQQKLRLNQVANVDKATHKRKDMKKSLARLLTLKNSIK